ncbi:MAG: PEP-CTERM sorting domain-containing protein [Armatimonadota bacterium]
MMARHGLTTRILVALISVAALSLCCALAAVADGTLLSGSITDQLVDTSKMYMVSSSELNGTLFIHGGTLPYDPLDTTGGAGVAQRGGGTGYQFMEYKAAPNKKLSHVKVSWMVLNTDNPFDGQIKLFDGADQILNYTDTHVLTDPDGWRWHITEGDFSSINLNSVRVAFVYGYSWEPQAGTVQVDVASVPEPGSLLALCMGTVSLVGIYRRRR